MTSTIAYISLGSNMGEAAAHLAEARNAIADLPGVRLAAASSVYRTQPQDDAQQPWFHNQVLALECDNTIKPDALLHALLKTENDMGRLRHAGRRFGPRVIDLDLLLFGTQIHHKPPHLIVPHPRMDRRAFVLVPLREIAPGLMLPDGRTVEDLVHALTFRVERDQIYQ